jgi:hypothetical protein
LGFGTNSDLKMGFAPEEGILSSGKKENRKEQDLGLNGAGRWGENKVGIRK